MNELTRQSSSPPAVADQPPALAARRDRETAARDFLGFVLGGERYAAPLPAVREIVKLPPVTEVPLAPPNVLGIISVRGKVTTLIDLRRMLKLPEKELAAKARVILVDKGEETMGVLVDSILQVYRLQDDQVEPASALCRNPAEYLLGIGRPGPRHLQSGDRKAGVPRGAQSPDRRAGISAGAEFLILVDLVTLLKG